MIVKTVVENFHRDTANHALINTNKEAYKLYKMQRSSNQIIEDLQTEMNSLKNDVSDIKHMLQQLIGKK